MSPHLHAARNRLKALADGGAIQVRETIDQSHVGPGFYLENGGLGTELYYACVAMAKPRAIDLDVVDIHFHTRIAKHQ